MTYEDRSAPIAFAQYRIFYLKKFKIILNG